MESSPAFLATPAPAATPDSDQPVVDSSPAAVATPAAAHPSPDQPVGHPSPAVVATPVTPTSHSEQRVVAPSPASAAPTPASQENPSPLTTEPELPAAAGLRSDNPAAASDNHPAPTTTAAPSIAPSQPAAIAADAAIDPNAPIVEQLHDLPNGKFDRIIGNTKQRASIDAFYSGRNYAPLWITDGKANARAKAAIAYLGRVSADGLDPADYPVPNFASLTDPVALAEAEIRLTISVVTYAHHAQIGRVHWSRVSGDIFYDRSAPDPGEVLTALMEATDVGAALDAYEPHSDGYRALKTKLAELRVGHLDTNKTRIPKLNGRQSDPRINIIMANMERWRWLPHDLGKTYRHRQSPRFHLARDTAGQAGLDDKDCGWQTGNTDPNHERADEVHHYQSDLECAGLDCLQGICAVTAAGSNNIAANGVAGKLQCGRHHPPLPAARGTERTRAAPFQFSE